MDEETLFWNLIFHAVLAVCYALSAIAVAVFCVKQQRLVGFTRPQFFVCSGLVLHHIGITGLHLYRIVNGALFENDHYPFAAEASWLENGVILAPVIGLVLLTAPVAMLVSRDRWWLVTLVSVSSAFVLVLLLVGHNFFEPILDQGDAPTARVASLAFASVLYLIVAILVATYLTWRETRLRLSADQVSVLMGVFLGAIAMGCLQGYKAHYVYFKSQGEPPSTSSSTGAHMLTLAVALFGQVYILRPVLRHCLKRL